MTRARELIRRARSDSAIYDSFIQDLADALEKALDVVGGVRVFRDVYPKGFRDCAPDQLIRAIERWEKFEKDYSHGPIGESVAMKTPEDMAKKYAYDHFDPRVYGDHLSKKTALEIKECEHGIDRRFSVFFEPDPKHKNFEVGMKFMIISVNRKTGEIKFALCEDCINK